MTNTADQDTAKAAATNTTGSNTSLSAHQLASKLLHSLNKFDMPFHGSREAPRIFKGKYADKSQINALWSRNYSKPAKYNWEKLKEEILNYYDAEWDAANIIPRI
ncbi:hypothetical protein BDQ17DRAFT_1432082 [Cyathus striatus]|nr:hypothetical protein BDQ17DRAFT_1432082 [Cyathus striatus]